MQITIEGTVKEVEGLVDMANILAPKVKHADKESEGKENKK